MSLCYLPVKDIPGITTNVFKQMGREGISTGAIIIKNVEIPSHYLIGDWNKGFYYAMEGFNCARPLVAAACIGAAGKALESGIEYLKERRVFGSPLAKFEGMQFQVAENYTKLESSRLLVYKAAWMLDQMYTKNRFGHKEINKAVASAKLCSTDSSLRYHQGCVDMAWCLRLHKRGRIGKGFTGCSFIYNGGRRRTKYHEINH